MNELEKKSLQAKKAKEFIDNHPALVSPYGEASQNLVWGIESACKRGEWESSKGMLSIRKGDKLRNWERFKDDFEKEEKEIDDENGDKKDIAIQKQFLSINKTYEEVYGEKWKFDHVVYFGEVSFFTFSGKIGTKDWMDFKFWNRYEGVHSWQQRTLEDMLIDIEKKVKKAFGNFTMYNNNLMSLKEIENHKGYNTMKFNKKYFEVNNDLYNLRWLRHFVDTDYCLKNWKEEFEWVKKMNLYPNG